MRLLWSSTLPTKNILLQPVKRHETQRNHPEEPGEHQRRTGLWPTLRGVLGPIENEGSQFYTHSAVLSQELLPDGVRTVFMSGHARGINVGDAPKNDKYIGELGVTSCFRFGCKLIRLLTVLVFFGCQVLTRD
jgi:hypothetical protein